MVKKKLALAVSALAASGTLWYLVSTQGVKIPVPSYRAIRVIDGDTFETEEKQVIRLASTEAPELDKCGGQEAKQQLEKLILGKPLYIKVVYQDPYHRQIGLVYSEKVFVNEAMLKSGSSYYYRASPGTIGKKLQQAGEFARKNQQGIFSSSCIQSVNPKQPQCNIKANIGRAGNIYYLPDCGVYPNVLLELYKGDQWFCTEAEAIKAGFRKPSQCP